MGDLSAEAERVLQQDVRALWPAARAAADLPAESSVTVGYSISIACPSIPLDDPRRAVAREHLALALKSRGWSVKHDGQTWTLAGVGA